MNRHSLFRMSLVFWVVAAGLLAACGQPAGTTGTAGTVGTSGAGAAPGQATAAATTAAAFPVTLTDDAGRQVRIAKAPQRIVSSAPSNTEILFALGLGDRVAAVTNFCDYPAEAKQKPKIGGLRPNLEAIVAQQPDLVLATTLLPAEALAALEGQQIPVAILSPTNFDGVLKNVRAVGRMTGATAAAERVAGEMQRRWNAVAEKAKSASSTPRVFYELDATDPSAVVAAGHGTFIDAMIAAAGGVNVAAAMAPGQQYPKVSAEAVLQANPQLIVLGDAPYGQSAETVAKRPGWSAVEAVQKGAVAGITDDNLISRPGPRLVEGLELMAKIIHPELFGALGR